MSDASETVRAALEAWNRRDLDELARHVTPDFRWIEHAESAVGPGERAGSGAVAGITAELDESFGSYAAELVELVEVGPELLVAVLRESGRGAGSGAPFETEFGYLIALRDGRAARIEVFRDPDDAFAAAGSHRPGRR